MLLPFRKLSLVAKTPKDTMTINLSKMVLAAAMAIAMSGCATDRSVGMAPGIAVADLAQLPPPSSSQAYTIGAQETIEIAVADSELLSGKFYTDANGYISYPLVGDLFVAGKTPGQAARMIADRLRGEYVLNPQVRVRPGEASTPTISIGGQVNAPGTFPAATSQSLLRAINNAGGLSEYAKHDDVLLMREVDGQRYIGVYNIGGIQRGNYADPAVYPNDVVMVGDSPNRRRLDTILKFFPLLTSSLLLLDRTAN